MSDEMDKAMEQGLPVGQILNLKEGGTLSGTLNLLQNALHPNAVKVFVNWLDVVAPMGDPCSALAGGAGTAGVPELYFVIIRS